MKSLRYDGDHPVKDFKSCSEYKIIHFVVSSQEKQQREAMLTRYNMWVKRFEEMRGAVGSQMRWLPSQSSGQALGFGFSKFRIKNKTGCLVWLTGFSWCHRRAVCFYKVVVICIEMEMHAVIPGYVNMSDGLLHRTIWKHFLETLLKMQTLSKTPWQVVGGPSVRAATRAELEAFLNETQPPNPVKRAKLSSKLSFNGEIQSSRSWCLSRIYASVSFSQPNIRRL